MSISVSGLFRSFSPGVSIKVIVELSVPIKDQLLTSTVPVMASARYIIGTVQDLPGPRLCPIGTGNPLAAAIKLDFPAPVVPSTRIARQACGGGCLLNRYVSRWHRKRI